MNFFISKANCRKKCDANLNLSMTRLRFNFYSRKEIINNIIVVLVSLKYLKKTKKIQVKPEIHFNVIFQRHNSFKEAKNFSRFRELSTLDQLSDKFFGQNKNFLTQNNFG